MPRRRASPRAPACSFYKFRFSRTSHSAHASPVFSAAAASPGGLSIAALHRLGRASAGVSFHASYVACTPQCVHAALSHSFPRPICFPLYFACCFACCCEAGLPNRIHFVRREDQRRRPEVLVSVRTDLLCIRPRARRHDDTPS